MKFTGLDVFDSTIQRTNGWLRDLMLELNWVDRRKTYLVFRSVLHAVRDHLVLNDAVYLGDQLPMLIRGFYFEHWKPESKPLPLRSREEYLAVLSNYLTLNGESAANAEGITRAVFRLLDRKAASGEIEDVSGILPAGLIDLWPPRLRAA